MFIDFRKKGGEKEKNQLVAAHMYPTRDGTHNLLVHGMTLQPIKLPGQG